MKIQVLSDLHLEFWGHAWESDAKPDVVVLAGDIYSGALAIPWAAATFPDIPVIYVAGNHEAYDRHLGLTYGALAATAEMFKNIHFLQKGELVLDGVRFLGTTLWTDFCLFGIDNQIAAMNEAERYMADYTVIKTGTEEWRNLRTFDTFKRFEDESAWLSEKLYTPFGGKTVVISHMGPSKLSVPDRYKEDLASSAFCSDLDDLAKMSNVWIHGHTHDSFDYMLGQCRVLCNPRGYPRRAGVGENPNFNPNLVIEI